jgi:hypothetical protein
LANHKGYSQRALLEFAANVKVVVGGSNELTGVRAVRVTDRDGGKSQVLHGMVEGSDPDGGQVEVHGITFTESRFCGIPIPIPQDN